ncbi:ABC transporter ATP-binding protein [Myxococcota bacterium]|nr:ABC transporter ATP-binding protein [Myxococcota bacterium]
MASETPTTALSVRNLSIGLPPDTTIPKISDISFSIAKGEILAIVGESGSGKTMISLALMGLLPNEARMLSGEIQLNGEEITEPDIIAKKRGREISMIFQEPGAALNPLLKIETQVTEHLRYHQKLNKKDALKRALAALVAAGLENPQELMKLYPHELSGGMQQRVMIAIAISLRPHLLIADEPTTSLDPPVEKRLLHRLQLLREKENLAMLYITHDLRLVRDFADTTMVLHQGRVVEIQKTQDLFTSPKQAYTQELLEAGTFLGF